MNAATHFVRLLLSFQSLLCTVRNITGNSSLSSFRVISWTKRSQDQHILRRRELRMCDEEWKCCKLEKCNIGSIVRVSLPHLNIGRRISERWIDLGSWAPARNMFNTFFFLNFSNLYLFVSRFIWGFEESHHGQLTLFYMANILRRFIRICHYLPLSLFNVVDSRPIMF